MFFSAVARTLTSYVVKNSPIDTSVKKLDSTATLGAMSTPV